MKCTQNLGFLVARKPNSLKLLCPQNPCFRDPCTIEITLLLKHPIPKRSTNIITVTKACHLMYTGIPDKI